MLTCVLQTVHCQAVPCVCIAILQICGNKKSHVTDAMREGDASVVYEHCSHYLPEMME